MRILIFLLALISAFFIPFSYSLDYPDEDYKLAKSEVYGLCETPSGEYVTKKDDCLAKVAAAYPQSSSFSEIEAGPNRVQFQYKYYGVFNNTYHYFTSNYETFYSCPPDNYPTHRQGPVFKPNDTNEKPFWCLPESPSQPEPERDPDCPAPTDNDPFVFGSGGGQTSVCFPAGNGRQCEIKTDANGGYYIPVSYGSLEPTTCVPDPEPEPEPEPEPTPDPDKPDDSDSPTPTPDPDNPEPPKDTDDSDKSDILDAVNQVNDNLNVINDNMNLGVETHTERLDRIAKETQNSNLLLDSIKKNTAATTVNTGKTITEIGKTNTILHGVKIKQGEGVKLLDEIKENTKKEDFKFTSGGRMAGGLDSVFTFEEMANFDTLIESEEKRRSKLIEKIKTESETLFTIDPNLSSQYEKRLETIKGVQVDLGVSRFSDFFKLIAPAILLAGTLTGLYILLGSNRE